MEQLLEPPLELPPRESSRCRGRSGGGGGKGDGKGKKEMGKRTRSHGDDLGKVGAMSDVEREREREREGGQDRGRRREMQMPRPRKYGAVEMVEVGGEWWL